jgi:hypothetical protein
MTPLIDGCCDDPLCSISSASHKITFLAPLLSRSESKGEVQLRTEYAVAIHAAFTTTFRSAHIDFETALV